MNAQADQMMAYVADLSAMVGARRRDNSKGGHPEAIRAEKAIERSQRTPVAVHESKKVNPEQLIPMGDDNLEDF